MNSKLFWFLIVLGIVTGCCAADEGVKQHTELSGAATQSRNGAIVLPGLTNAIQFRLYTNASPDSPHLFNTIEIEAYGEMLLPSPGGDELKGWLATSPTNSSLHNILVNGAGPQLAVTNGMTVIEQASGPDWRYIALDATSAYRGRLEQFKRGVLFVEPDLFVLYDHLVAQKPVSFQMLVHPPAATRLDTIWRDLRLELPKGGLRISAPAGRHALRSWERIESAADSILPGTVTMQLGPTNKLAQLDLLTVFAVYRGGEKKNYAFKLLESNNAVGARIHREGLPTLVAFKTDVAVGEASLTGFGFSGPVGVHVFRPKQTKP
jgi:hypothetical protein